MPISRLEARHQALLDELFEELKGRIKEDDSSVPIRDGDFLYWWAFKPGAQYRTWYRKPAEAATTRSSSTSRPRQRARNISGSVPSRPSPDGKLARDAGGRQWVGTLPAPRPRHRDGQGYRDGHRRRHRAAGVD